ncbi:MAG: hypothetical protein ACYDAQ_09455 [Mycobacteriales bacterium]
MGEIVGELKRANAEIGDLINRLGDSPSVEEYLEARARIGRLQADFDEYNNELSRALGVSSARARILRYLQAHVGEVVAKEELGGVAGIFEFQRRIRELRADEGWQISSMETHTELRPGEYMLLSHDRDPSLTSDWDLARRVRREPGSGVERLVRLLRAAGGHSVDPSVVRFALAPEDLDETIERARSGGFDIVTLNDPPGLRLQSTTGTPHVHDTGKNVYDKRVRPRA